MILMYGIKRRNISLGAVVPCNPELLCLPLYCWEYRCTPSRPKMQIQTENIGLHRVDSFMCTLNTKNRKYDETERAGEMSVAVRGPGFGSYTQIAHRWLLTQLQTSFSGHAACYVPQQQRESKITNTLVLSVVYNKPYTLNYLIKKTQYGGGDRRDGSAVYPVLFSLTIAIKSYY